MKTILILEDDVIFSRSIGNWLKKKGMATEHAATLSAARKALSAREFDLVLADLRLPDGNSTSLLEWMNERFYATPFLIMTNYGQVENAVEAMQLGAVNYLCKPVQPDRLLEAIGKIFSRPRHDGNEFYRGESAKAREMYQLVGLVARSDISVLIRGASGTGKEHIARELHEQSHRRDKPFVAVDCGTITGDLAKSEFFGHRKGTFTGAYGDRYGLFQVADGGTLFLDEIGNLSPETQMLLLRALQERRYKPVGSTQEYTFDVRLVAATNENLERAISEGRFREDLFHRLNEFTINVPPLSECGEDILPLAEFFVKHFSEKHRKPVRGFNSLAAASLQKYPWPGNIRELRNCIQRAVLLSADGWISPEELNLDLAVGREETAPIPEEKEKQLLLRTLEEAEGNRARAARILGISRTSLYGKYSINSLVYWVTYVHNVVYSFYRSMIYCYINSTQRCAGSIVIDIIPTNGADKRKFFPFAPYFPVTNVIKRYFYPYFPAIIGIKGYSFPYFPYLSGIMKIKTALYSLFSRLDWHKTVVFPCLGEIYEGIRSLSWEIPVT